jgi:hypothetical protein
MMSVGTGLGIGACDFGLVGYVTTGVVRQSVALLFIIG